MKNIILNIIEKLITAFIFAIMVDIANANGYFDVEKALMIMLNIYSIIASISLFVSVILYNKEVEDDEELN